MIRSISSAPQWLPTLSLCAEQQSGADRQNVLTALRFAWQVQAALAPR